MGIRIVRKEDCDQIYRLVQTAFSTAQVSDGTEQDFVLELRRRPGYIPGLELAAEENGRLVGHIMLTEQAVEGRQVKALLLAPLCVALEYRNRGDWRAAYPGVLCSGQGNGLYGRFSHRQSRLLRAVRLPACSRFRPCQCLRRPQPVRTGL